MPIIELNKRLEYRSPEDKNGKHYWVPIVVKNKDTLVGFTEGINLMTSITDSEIIYSPSMALSSERLNDTTIDGRRLYLMDDKELEKYITGLLKKSEARIDSTHEDDECGIADEYYFHMSCGNCHNFFGYRSPNDIPDKDVVCEICDRTVLEYINVDDSDLTYVGIDIDKMNEKIYEIKEKLGF